MALIDFTQQHWGHALHGSTFREIEPRRERRWFRKPSIYPRAEVMVHCTPMPRVGDIIRFTMKRAGTIDRRVVDVKPCYDPHDMHTITLEWPEQS